MIHTLSDVQSSQIGGHTQVWQYCVVLPGAKIGDYCNICSHCFIENDVVIGDRVTIKCGVQIWDGITIEDDVFVGPNATFTNDMVPRSRQIPAEFARTTIKQGASIGANATIVPGLTIGQSALVGAGAVVTKDVADFAVVYGSPAKQRGWICRCGNRLNPDSTIVDCECGCSFLLQNDKLEMRTNAD